MELKNKNVIIEFDNIKKEISARDLTDRNNEPAMYTKGRRNVEKVWYAFVLTFTPGTTFSDLNNFLTTNNIKYHYWCMMD
jgi:hypothetical protein